ncbi:unnamed protein product, partial [Rotaria sp. Silwood2]
MAMNNTNSYHTRSLHEQYNNKINNYCSKPRQDFNMLGLNPFQPLKSFRIGEINRFATMQHLLSFVEQIDKTKTFSIDTERHPQLGMVTLIKIELIQVEQKESIVLCFELLHLPFAGTPLFLIVGLLLNKIFHPSKRIFVWSNDNKEALQTFVLYKYLAKSTLGDTNIIILQLPFKQWYNKTFKHHEKCHVTSVINHDAYCCICPYRPYKNLNNQWALEKAINHVFQEFIRQPNGNYIDHRQNFIYSVYRCLAISKLLMVVELDWTLDQLHQFKKFHQ